MDAIRAVKLGRRKGVKIGNFVFESPRYVSMTLDMSQLEASRTVMAWKPFARALRHSDSIIANSVTTQREVEEWIHRSDVEVVYPGVDFIEAETARKAGCDKRSQIVYVGRLVSYKNVETILMALSTLKSAPTLVICGDGAKRRDLEALAAELGVACVFRGWVSELEKWNEIKRSLFMVFPSSLEGFGMPPAEAFACSVPCITTDMPVLREVYGDHVDYFKERDVAQLASVMRRLLEDPAYRDARGRAGFEYIKGKLSWRKSAEKIVQIALDRN
jgi:glycosyltransferase involved in cell wall biosynthesis